MIRAGAGLEFEAFVLNELCQFTGAFCNSLHCDELGHLCRVPYELGRVRRKLLSGNDVNFDDEALTLDEEGYLCGATGCGLCALYALQRAGITHLKLVGRGNHADFYGKRYPEFAESPEYSGGLLFGSGLPERDETTAFPAGLQRKLLLCGIRINSCRERSASVGEPKKPFSSARSSAS